MQRLSLPLAGVAVSLAVLASSAPAVAAPLMPAPAVLTDDQPAADVQTVRDRRGRHTAGTASGGTTASRWASGSVSALRSSAVPLPIAPTDIPIPCALTGPFMSPLTVDAWSPIIAIRPIRIRAATEGRAFRSTIGNAATERNTEQPARARPVLIGSAPCSRRAGRVQGLFGIEAFRRKLNGLRVLSRSP